MDGPFNDHFFCCQPIKQQVAVKRFYEQAGTHALQFIVLGKPDSS